MLRGLAVLVHHYHPMCDVVLCRWCVCNMHLFASIILLTRRPATGAGSVYSISQATVNKEDIFAPGTGPWITSFLAATLFTNLLSTCKLPRTPSSAATTDRHVALLAYRIWSIGRRMTNVALATGIMWPVVRVILDAGILYSLSLLAALVCFIAQNHGHYVLLDMVRHPIL
jgi:hypothetical protein